MALKSIIAYRSGLQIEAMSRDEAAADWKILKERARSAGRVRLDRKALCDYLVSLALAEADRQELPIQFHTGFGDADADLRVANPLHLRTVIERYPRLPLVLLHAGWPYYRELTHLAAIYPNVWLDLSLAIPFATTGIPDHGARRAGHGAVQQGDVCDGRVHHAGDLLDCGPVGAVGAGGACWTSSWPTASCCLPRRRRLPRPSCTGTPGGCTWVDQSNGSITRGGGATPPPPLMLPLRLTFYSIYSTPCGTTMSNQNLLLRVLLSGMWMCLISRYSWNPHVPSSRPIPLCL